MQAITSKPMLTASSSFAGHRECRALHPHWVFTVLVGLILCNSSWGQAGAPKAKPVHAEPAQPQDPLGRGTPRGTVLGFLAAARRGEYGTAVEYLNTTARGPKVISLARELQVVLDRSLPATLNQVSIAPEGSRNYGIDPNLDLVGTISTVAGDVDITVERLNRPNTGPVWLFSRKTVAAIPDLYEQVDSITLEERLPRVLSEVRILRVPLYEWLALVVGVPLVFLSTVLLNRALGAAAGYARRRWRHKSGLPDPPVVIGPIRLLIVACVIRFALSRVILPLLARQAWAAISFVIAVVGCAWLAIKLNGWGERAIIPRIEKNFQAGGALLRFGRRGVDLLVMLAALIIMLRYFGLNTSTVFAGLGVGGIAIALAAQKTLENVIGGLSLIFDQTVRLGDAVKVAGTMGSVDRIGLRSTRIRTLDRTVLSVPNGQIANASLENLSARDSYRFCHTVSLRYESTDQIQETLDAIRSLLARDAGVDTASARVRLVRLGASTLEIEVYALLFSRDWNAFLELQEQLLLRIMKIVEKK